MRFLVTGSAGFIGSHLTDRLLAAEHDVIGYDNLSTGRRSFLTSALECKRFRLVQADILDCDRLTQVMRDVEFVFHLAANADVRRGAEHPRKDFEQNTLGTMNVLEAVRKNEVAGIAFASTGSIYGEARIFPTPENAPMPIQTSLYGASKLAGEGFIQAYAEAFGIRAFIFRFVSILGSRYTHGHVFDFYKQLLAHPDHLEILGNGKQKKSYLHVSDCLDGIMLALEKSSVKMNIFNLGTDHYCEVDASVDCITQQLGLSPRRIYTGSDRGWIGDNPFIFLDCSAIRSLGWRPKFDIKEAVISTVSYLQSGANGVEAKA
jgi:UDP-glucose 4-epimerase